MFEVKTEFVRGLAVEVKGRGASRLPRVTGRQILAENQPTAISCWGDPSVFESLVQPSFDSCVTLDEKWTATLTSVVGTREVLRLCLAPTYNGLALVRS